MGKTYVGSRLRQLRRDYDLSQASLAATLGLSASYVNQIEHDVRPLTDPVLDRITSAFDVDATFFSRDDNSRLLAEVQDAMLDKDLYPTPVDVRELAELVDNHPAIARAVVAMHQRYRNTRTALALADGLDWNDLHTATPIGASCYVCTREDCAQRAYPPRYIAPYLSTPTNPLLPRIRQVRVLPNQGNERAVMRTRCPRNAQRARVAGADWATGFGRASRSAAFTFTNRNGSLKS